MFLKLKAWAHEAPESITEVAQTITVHLGRRNAECRKRRQRLVVLNWESVVASSHWPGE